VTDIVTARSESILRIQFNRSSKKNAVTSAMYITMADLLDAGFHADKELGNCRLVTVRSQQTIKRSES
jgi:enoyl-CoA hydratase/carnithine racemase